MYNVKSKAYGSQLPCKSLIRKNCLLIINEKEKTPRTDLYSWTFFQFPALLNQPERLKTHLTSNQTASGAGNEIYVHLI